MGSASYKRKQKRLFDDISRENRKIIEEYLDFRENVMHKSKGTVATEKSALCSIARSVKKSFKDITEKDTQKYFKALKCRTTADTYAILIIKFYKWLLKLKRTERPECLEWYEYESQREKRKRKDPNAKEKYFIYKDEYDAIIINETDLQKKALWETCYLSGARPSELRQMNICHVKDDGEVVTITIIDSKTIPRNVPLPKYPKYLMQWLSEHPFKDNPNDPLWISIQRRKRLYHSRMRNWFKTALKRADIKENKIKTLTPKCFRKTRASIIFNNTRWTDTNIADFMGWEVAMVPFRRREYDLTNAKDLREKILGNITRPPSIDELQWENKRLKEKADEIIQEKVEQIIKEEKPEIQKMKEQLFEMRTLVEMMSSTWYKMLPEQDKEKYRENELLSSYLFGGTPREKP